ncbi:hypothetical protein M427DRAFT_152339 [Gonapodya prolifera JEL478]|uniref:Uncharacterized protein n=1 Tax=Gonapodya prolifera (strain JEL478) TaxID=1344416 RepID=A0A139ATL0_GONPJ|nr:hypothetical protein M427DRAFT_152339 [Gonapodya prolifera JEL478]|eukprot:KXS19903.1 hypothetical protein M427DRAFT_152339 [Gonapodya prolifera JEL478]
MPVTLISSAPFQDGESIASDSAEDAAPFHLANVRCRFGPSLAPVGLEGDGKLWVTADALVWFSPSGCRGVSIPLSNLAVYAKSRSPTVLRDLPELFPPCVYCQLEDGKVTDEHGVDVEEAKAALAEGWKAELVLSRKREEEEERAANGEGGHANGNGNTGGDGDEEWEDVEPEGGEDDSEDDGFEKVLEIRLAPGDTSQLDGFWQALSSAASAHQSSSGGNAMDDEDPGDAFISADDPAFAEMDPSEWFFTAEGAERLTEEGRRRLEEMEEALEPQPTARFHPYAARRGRRGGSARGEGSDSHDNSAAPGGDDAMEEE